MFFSTSIYWSFTYMFTSKLGWSTVNLDNFAKKQVLFIFFLIVILPIHLELKVKNLVDALFKINFCRKSEDVLNVEMPNMKLTNGISSDHTSEIITPAAV